MSREFGTPSAIKDNDISLSLSREQLDFFMKKAAIYENEGPEIKDFINVYGKIETDKDAAEVGRLKKIFRGKEQDKKSGIGYGKILELVLMDFAGSWLPGYFSKTSEFDDFKNHSDLLWEIDQDDGNVLRVLLDVTCDQNQVDEKVKKYFSDRVLKNRFQTIKYFESQLEERVRGKDANGQFYEFPKIIIGADASEIAELAKAYFGYATNSKNLDNKDRFGKLINEHRLGKELIRQTIMQLELQLGVLKRSPDKKSAAGKIKMIEELLSCINGFRALNDESETDNIDGSYGNKITAAIDKALESIAA